MNKLQTKNFIKAAENLIKELHGNYGNVMEDQVAALQRQINKAKSTIKQRN